METVFLILVDSYRITEIQVNPVSGFETAPEDIPLVCLIAVLVLVER